VRRFLYTSDGQSTTGVGSGWAGRDGGVALRQGEWLPGMSETHLATSSKEALDSINKSHILNSRCVVVPSLFYRICSSIRQYYFWNIMHRSWFVRLSRSAAYSRVPGGMTAPGARGPWQYARRPMRARAREHTHKHTLAQPGGAVPGPPKCSSRSFSAEPACTGRTLPPSIPFLASSLPPLPPCPLVRASLVFEFALKQKTKTKSARPTDSGTRWTHRRSLPSMLRLSTLFCRGAS
jgi:hypothetical protein